MGYELGLPTKFYHYTASFEKGLIVTGAYDIPKNTKDNGVFIQRVESEDVNSAYCEPSPYRGTSICYRACGGTNMETSSEIGNMTRIILRGYGSTDRINLILAKGTDIAHIAGYNQLLSRYNSTTPNSGLNPFIHQITVHKTEVACPFSWSGDDVGTGECVYATGISAIGTSEDGTKKTQTIIIARVTTDGMDYPELYKEPSSTSWSLTGSIGFYEDGVIETKYLIPGDNLSGVTSTTIATAFPEAAMVSNDGIIAVSCMVNADGVTRWVGYKNGIYKLYNGSEPLYGMPGERITVKGHEFVSLAYSPFYARLS